MPYRVQKNKEGYRVFNLRKKTSFQFHSHDKDKLDKFLKQREAFSHGFVPTHLRTSNKGRTHKVKAHRRR